MRRRADIPTEENVAAGLDAAELGGGGGGMSPDTTPPTITSANSASVAENATLSHSLTANESVTWSLNGGADVAKFAIGSGTGALTFVTSPNFDIAGDADGNNTYIVGVQATDTATNATVARSTGADGVASAGSRITATAGNARSPAIWNWTHAIARRARLAGSESGS